MTPIYHYDIEQNTPEWIELRRGRVGGSSCSVLTTLPAKKDRDNGAVLAKGALSLIDSIVADKLGYYEEGDGFMSDAMMSGHIFEPYARAAYSADKFVTVQECGYISLGEYLGYSPDGLVGDDGILEIKCPGGKEFVRVASGGAIKPEYVDQMQFGLFVTGRKWCDHVTYNQYDQSYVIQRFERDDEVMERFGVACTALIKAVEVKIEFVRANVKQS